MCRIVFLWLLFIHFHSLLFAEFCEHYRKKFTSKDELQRAADEYISKQDQIFEAVSID